MKTVAFTISLLYSGFVSFYANAQNKTYSTFSSEKQQVEKGGQSHNSAKLTFNNPLDLQKKWFFAVDIAGAFNIDVWEDRRGDRGLAVDVDETGSFLGFNAKYINPKMRSIVEFDANGLVVVDYDQALLLVKQGRLIYSPVFFSTLVERTKDVPDGTTSDGGSEQVQGMPRGTRTSTATHNTVPLKYEYAKLTSADIGLQRNVVDIPRNKSYYSAVAGLRRTRVTNLRYKIFYNGKELENYFKGSPKKLKKYQDGYTIRTVSTFRCFAIVPFFSPDLSLDKLNSKVGGGIGYDVNFQTSPIGPYPNFFLGFEIIKNCDPPSSQTDLGSFRISLRYGLSF